MSTLNEKSRNPFIFLTFLALGHLQLAGWNSLLCIIIPVGAEPQFTFLPLLIRFVYGVILLLGNLFFFKFTCVNLVALVSGLTSVPLVLFLYALSYTFFHNSINFLFPLISIVLTVGSVLIGVAGFGFAVRFSNDYSGAMSAGLGFSGLITYVFWFICTSFFNIAEMRGAVHAFWLMFAFTFIIYLKVMFLLFYTINFTEMGDVVHGKHEGESDYFDSEIDKSNQLADDDYISGGYKLLLKKAWTLGIPTFLVLFITLLVFPAIGPVLWFNAEQVHVVSLFTGIFILGDLFGRYFPNVFPFLMFTPRLIHIITHMRWLFVVTFVLSALYPENGLFGSVYFLTMQMVLLSITSGLLSTATFVRAIETVNGSRAKEKVASFCLICVALSIFLSQALGIPFVKLVLGLR